MGGKKKPHMLNEVFVSNHCQQLFTPQKHFDPTSPYKRLKKVKMNVARERKEDRAGTKQQ